MNLSMDGSREDGQGWDVGRSWGGRGYAHLVSIRSVDSDEAIWGKEEEGHSKNLSKDTETVSDRNRKSENGGDGGGGRGKRGRKG